MVCYCAPIGCQGKGSTVKTSIGRPSQMNSERLGSCKVEAGGFSTAYTGSNLRCPGVASSHCFAHTHTENTALLREEVSQCTKQNFTLYTMT